MKEHSRKKSVMVIDDTKPIRILIWKTLDKEFNVLLEDKASEALETISVRGHDIDLIILDYEMPEMNGDVLYAHIHKIIPDVPVIVLSASLTKDRIERFRVLGIKSFLSKPVNISRLRAEIKNIFDE